MKDLNPGKYFLDANDYPENFVKKYIPLVVKLWKDLFSVDKIYLSTVLVVLNNLPGKERDILTKHYCQENGNNLSLMVLAKEYGCTTEGIRFWEKKAFAKFILKGFDYFKSNVRFNGIEILRLSEKAYNGLIKNGISTVDELVNCDFEILQGFHYVGVGIVLEIITKLREWQSNNPCTSCEVPLAIAGINADEIKELKEAGFQNVNDVINWVGKVYKHFEVVQVRKILAGIEKYFNRHPNPALHPLELTTIFALELNFEIVSKLEKQKIYFIAQITDEVVENFEDPFLRYEILLKRNEWLKKNNIVISYFKLKCIGELGLKPRTLNPLKRAGLVTVQQLEKLEKKDFLRIPSFSHISYKDVMGKV